MNNVDIWRFLTCLGNARSTAGCIGVTGHLGPPAPSHCFFAFLTTDNWCFRCSGDWPPRQVLVQCNMSRRSWPVVFGTVSCSMSCTFLNTLTSNKILLNARLNGLFGAAFYPHCVVHISHIYMIIYIYRYIQYIYILFSWLELYYVAPMLYLFSVI